jgi:hypothetical protein
MAYDPQRNRARAQPSADEPAPVDMVLEGTTEDAVLESTVEAVEPVVDVRDEPASVTVEPVAQHEVHPHDHAHVHGPACDHDHGDGPDLRLIVAAGVATVVAAVVLRRVRRARAA